MGLPPGQMPGVPQPMVGGMPPQMMGQQPFPQPQMMPAPLAQPAMPAMPSRPFVQAPLQQMQAPLNDQPIPTVIRGVSGESLPTLDVRRTPQPEPPLDIPSPEQLDVAPPKPHDPGLDWKAIRKRLDDLKAIGFQLDPPLPDGRYRFVCWMATAELGQKQGIEGVAATEIEAVNQCLARAEQWRRRH